MSDIAPALSAATVRIRHVGADAPWRWLSAAWSDLWQAPGVSLAYGFLLVAASFGLSFGLYLADLFYLVLPLAAGFMFVAPVLAVGLYEVSRRLETGEPVTLSAAVTAWRRNGQILLMGLLLTLFLLAWIRLAFLIFALFFGTEPPSSALFVNTVLLSPEGLPFLAVGTAVGGVLAGLVFAMSAVSIPMLLDRDVNVIDAMLTSIAAVRQNWRVMLGWAALIVVFTAAGIATAFLGLAVALPLIGHASWHAYRDLVAIDSR
jgi:uncharacterized membrane protein